MMKNAVTVALSALTALALSGPLFAEDKAPGVSAHQFSFESIEGDALSLADYAGGPVLVVNTASRCGFTHQYDGLQKLYDAHREAGLVVLAVPSNDFRQELSSAEKVKEFCEVNFGLDIPMTDIVSVKGAGAHPLFAWFAEQGAVPRWNFNKFLIDADGKFVAHFGSGTAPESSKIVGLIGPMLSGS